MKTLTFGRYLGIGLGVGIASMALYSITNDSAPQAFHAQQGEFRSLAELDSDGTPLANDDSGQFTMLTRFEGSESDNNSILLPATDELTAKDLQLDASLFDELVNATNLDESVSTKNSEPQLAEGEQAAVSEPAETKVITEADAEPVAQSAEPSGSESSAKNAQPAPAAEPTRMFEVAGSSWAKNPFSDGSVPPVAKPADESKSNQFTGDVQAEKQDVVKGQAPLFSKHVSNAAPSSFAGDPYSIAPVDLALSDAIAQRAAHHIEYGKTLARRGASYAARQEFYSALRVIAQANDAKVGVNEFSRALRQGIIALKEAEDFVVTDTESQIGMNVSLVSETHRAGILTEADAKNLTTVEAMQRYFSVAQEQLLVAGGRNVVSAEALYCLGKLHSVVAQHEPAAGRLDTAKAIVYHRAALSSDKNNYRSAGELGVLMARSGQLEDAKDLIKQSLVINPVPQSWENLAKVHDRLGERNLAQLAQSEQQRAAQVARNESIQWMANDRFNASAPLEFHDSVASKPADLQAAPAPQAKQEEKPKSFSQRIKDLF